MFDSIPDWGWVAAAWGEVVLAYVGYGFYLRRRAKRLEEASSNV